MPKFKTIYKDISSIFYFGDKKTIVSDISWTDKYLHYGMVKYDGVDNFDATTEYINISAYQGMTLSITMPRSDSYGLVFYDADEKVSTETGWHLNNGNGENGTVATMEIAIPETAVSVRTTYFNKDGSYGSVLDETPFNAKVYSPDYYSKVIIKDVDDSILESMFVKNGEKINEPATIPTKTGAGEVWEFAGWDFDFAKDPITQNTVITPKFNLVSKDITSSFTWTNNFGIIADPNNSSHGDAYGDTSTCKNSNFLDLTKYKGYKLEITLLKTSGSAGLAFTSNTNTYPASFISGFRNMSENGEKVNASIVEVEIPNVEGSVYIRTTYLIENPSIDFSAKIVSKDYSEVLVENYDGTIIESRFVKNGEKVTEPALSLPENVQGQVWTFNGWDFDFNNEITKYTVIKPNVTVDIKDSFGDLSTWHAYYLVNGYNGVGTLNSKDYYICSDFIDVTEFKGKTLRISVYGTTESTGLAFYDKAGVSGDNPDSSLLGKFLSGYVHNTAEVVEITIPNVEGNVYIRTSYNTNFTLPFSAVILFN